MSQNDSESTDHQCAPIAPANAGGLDRYIMVQKAAQEPNENTNMSMNSKQ